MKHEILKLNSSRTYVLVDDTWYDTHVDLNPKTGQGFLNGRIEKILSYKEYTEEFPESKNEMYDHVSEKFISGGYIRRVVDGLVKYAVNPATPAASSMTDKNYE
jgi:hypothetical protein